MIERVVTKQGIPFDGGIFVARQLARYVGQGVLIRADGVDTNRLAVFELDGFPICIAVAPDGARARPARLSRRMSARDIADWFTWLEQLRRGVAERLDASWGKARKRVIKAAVEAGEWARLYKPISSERWDRLAAIAAERSMWCASCTGRGKVRVPGGRSTCTQCNGSGVRADAR